jgi:hypothetical protein
MIIGDFFEITIKHPLIFYWNDLIYTPMDPCEQAEHIPAPSKYFYISLRSPIGFYQTRTMGQ